MITISISSDILQKYVNDITNISEILSTLVSTIYVLYLKSLILCILYHILIIVHIIRHYVRYEMSLVGNTMHVYNVYWYVVCVCLFISLATAI